MPRPLASLSSGLLARPGQAKPAMRPQVFAPQPLDDLGWNDMGTAPAAPQPTPQPAPPPVPQPAADTPPPAPVPPVLAERAELARAVAPAPAAPAPAARTRPAREAGVGRAAFTLRLDANRHLKLRLASAVSGQSSQQLVVAALDAFLDAQPQVDVQARRVPAANAIHPSSGETQ